MKFQKAIPAVISAAMLMGAASVCCADGDAVTVTINGKAAEFDVPPQIIDGRTLVPMRAIFEELGAEVEWNGDTKAVTAVRGDTAVKMVIGDTAMNVNGNTVALDVPPQIINDRTLVPARAVAESFDAQVSWNGDTRTVTITTVSDAKPVQTTAPVSDSEASPAESSNNFGIEYDESIELETDYIRDFKITGLEKTADGRYDITYTLKTFLEGRGVVSVSFRCYDKNGRTVDSWTKGFIGTDYTWSPHEDKITVSGDTVRIELVPAKN